jgi:dihydrofolate reductase
MIISCIVAIAKNRVIGKDNDIPWYLPADLKYFKKITTGHHILMGRKCYQSIGRPLPNRTNVIITRDPFFISTNCLVAHSIEEALSLAYDNGEKECFIIGGGTIYEQTADLWDKLYLTTVDLEPEGDIFFPEIDLKKWSLVSEDPHPKNEKNEFNYSFKILEKK